MSANHGQGWGYKEFGKIKILALCVNNAVGSVYKDNRLVHNPRGEKETEINGFGVGASTRNTTLIIILTNLKLDGDELKQMNQQVNVSIGESIRPFNTF